MGGCGHLPAARLVRRGRHGKARIMVEIQRHGGYIAVSRNVAMSRMRRMSRPAGVCVAASRGYRGVANRLCGGSMPCNDGAHPVDEPTGGMPAYLPKVLVGVLLACALVFGWSVYSPDTVQSATPRHTVTYSVQQGGYLVAVCAAGDTSRRRCERHGARHRRIESSAIHGTYAGADHRGSG